MSFYQNLLAIAASAQEVNVDDVIRAPPSWDLSVSHAFMLSDPRPHLHLFLSFSVKKTFETAVRRAIVGRSEPWNQGKQRTSSVISPFMRFRASHLDTLIPHQNRELNHAWDLDHSRLCRVKIGTPSGHVVCEGGRYWSPPARSARLVP